MKEKIEKKETPTLKFQKDRDKEMVRGIFVFHEVPGGSMSFVYKSYRGDEVERYDMIDGQMYTIPLGVARHLNKNVSYPVHAYAVDANGKPLMTIGSHVRRASFQSLEFIETDDLTPFGKPLVTVEAINPGL